MSLTPPGASVAFSPSPGDSIVSIVSPMLGLVLIWRPARSQTAASSFSL